MGTEEIQLNISEIARINKENYNFKTYSSIVRKFNTIKLDGNTRLNLINEVSGGIDLQESNPRDLLSKLFINDYLRGKIRGIIYDAIGKYLVVDPTKLGTLRVRFSNKPPASNEAERSLGAQSIDFYNDAELTTQVSDGVKAFSGIIATLIAGDPTVVLLDEPEAFLHPALSMKLGKEIGIAMNNSEKRLFVSTHSAAFIMGCIQSKVPINIVRFTYKSKMGSTRILAREKLLHLMSNPMLRSTGVLEGLFFEAVIVTEGDSDRAFYQEINERLRSAKDSRGIGNCLFINAQNKQTVWDIVKPLKEIGIPAIGIVDLDMVKDGGADFTRMVDAIFYPPIQHHAMSDTRNRIKQALDAKVPTTAQTGGDVTKNWWKRNGGIEVLDSADNRGANHYFEQFEVYGAFVVRNGELESWLRPLGVPMNKKRWLPEIFAAMGENPASPNYIQPSSGDVWDFIGRMKQWLDNPVRCGIPD